MGWVGSVGASAGEPIVIDKTVAVFTSRGRAVAQPRLAALAELARAVEIVGLPDRHACGALWERLAVEPGELERWEQLSRRLRIPFHDGVITQFEGYEALDELRWAAYRRHYGNIGRLDLILEAEGDSTNR